MSSRLQKSVTQFRTEALWFTAVSQTPARTRQRAQ